MRLLVRVACVAVCIAVQARSQYLDGTTSLFPFLKFDDNARTIAMGGASAALANGIYGAAVNPAATGYLTRNQAMIGYQSLILDAWAGPIGYAIPYKNYGVFFSNIMYASHGYLDSSESRDEYNNPTGATFHVFSLVGSLGWSKLVYDNLSVGLTCKGIYHPIKSSLGYYSSATAMAFDGGLQYRMLNSHVILGAALQNAGFVISNYSKDFSGLSLPLAVTVGASYEPLYVPGLRVTCDLQKSNDDYLNYKPGIEFALYKKVLFGRAGYTFSEADLEELLKEMKNTGNPDYVKSYASGLSLGLGLVTAFNGVPMNVDIAFLQRVQDLTPTFALSFLVEY